VCDGRGGAGGVGAVGGVVVRFGHWALRLQELRWPGKGKCNILVEGVDWSMFWSGEDMGHQ
jgi:hypothetical protein